MSGFSLGSAPDLPFMLSMQERSRLGAGRRLVIPDARIALAWHLWEPAMRRPPEAAVDDVPLVLFHGGSGSWTHWVKNIAPLVDAGRRVFAVDLPGFGDSDPPAGGGDADSMVEPLAESFAQLFGSQPVDLVGFSFGGMTAGMLLAAHPQLARRLVLVGAPAMGVVPERQFELKAWRHLKTPQERAEAHRYNLGALMLHEPHAIDALALEVHITNVQRDRLPRRRLAHTDILARSLPKVPCPVFAIYGAHDALYRQYIHELAQRFAETAPDFRGMTLIEGAGHWVQFEAPQAFDAALLAALGRQGG